MRRETFATPGPVLLTLKLPRGQVELETHDGEETTVELEAMDGSERGERQIERSEITLRERGDGYEVVVDADPEDFGFRKGSFTISISGRRDSIRARVRLPHGADLDVQTGSADINAAGRFGDVETKTASGDIHFAEIEGNAAIKVAAGDVAVERVGGSLKLQTAAGDAAVGPVGGSVDVKTASGDVNVEEAGGNVSVQSASGDLRIGAVREGSVELKSVSGDVLVGVRRGSRVYMDVKTVTGDARSELEVGDAPDDGEGPLVNLKATAMSGDIKIVRA
jgi:putative adhesin